MLKELEFNKLAVVDSSDGSRKYISLFVEGNKIEISTTIKVGDFDFDVDYIIQQDSNRYRLINSNMTLIVEKT